MSEGLDVNAEPRALTPGRPPLRVVLVNYRTADLIERLLTSSLFSSRDEVIVVDNNSDPDRVAGWQDRFGVAAVHMPSNVGFAKAVNRAVQESQAADRPLLILNPDVDISPQTLSQLCDELFTSGATGVAPLLTYPSGRVQVGAAGGRVSVVSVSGYFLGLSQLLSNLHGFFWTRRQLRRGGRADWLCMACLLLQPNAFDRFGPIPEDELVYAEDIAWGTSATDDGAQFLLIPSARAVHIQGAAGGKSVWSAAVARLIRRRLPDIRGIVAVTVMRLGLRLRRSVGRDVGW